MTTKPAYRIVPLPRDYVQTLRRTMTDRFGHRLQVFVNKAHGNPCRFSLRQSPPGEELLLLSHRPFAQDHPYAEIGPIFIRLRGDEGYDRAEGPIRGSVFGPFCFMRRARKALMR